MSKVYITNICPICGKQEAHQYEKEQFDSWVNGKLIQEAMPDINAFDREFLISGFCFDCISELFNAPKPGEDWGEPVGECDTCGAPIYEKDVKSGICPTCKEPLN